MSAASHHDVVIVGAGVAGALMAKHLSHAGLTVLVLEAGPATAQSFDGYAAHLETFYAASAKGPESAWPPAKGAPQPNPGDKAYFIQNGPNTYGSSYTRTQGGSTLHWLGVCLRMLPADFKLKSLYGVGRDWPIDYDALEPFYRKAEHEIGVSADVGEQAHSGLRFAAGYDFPMHRMPPSFSDQLLAQAIDGMQVTVGGEQTAVRVRGYPAARNGMPRGDYRPVGALDERPGGDTGMRNVGERCAGNTACTPICPIQAKYNAGKTLAQADRGHLTVKSQCVASKVLIDAASGLVEGIEYKRYDDAASVQATSHQARGRIYVLAAHAVENAKLLLASGLGGDDSAIGRHLMDHPALYAWGLAPAPVGPFRGPLSTAGIEDLRGGRFRSRHAAFRFDIGNDGWRAVTGAPDSTVVDAVMTRKLHGKALRHELGAMLSRQVRFSVAVEQLPDPGNRIGIDPGRLDPLGNPRPVISYRIDDYTLRGMVTATGVYQEIFRRAGIADCTNDKDNAARFFPAKLGADTFYYHGMGHFAGTHLMGGEAKTSVVDHWQRAWAHRNLYLVGSGSFPTMGTSNPTLTLAALTIRTAEHLIAELAKLPTAAAHGGSE